MRVGCGKIYNRDRSKSIDKTTTRSRRNLEDITNNLSNFHYE